MSVYRKSWREIAAMPQRLTPHQRDSLVRLAHRATRERTIERPGDWVHVKDSGAPAAMEHLRRKGYVERRIETGPRGGEHLLYRPNDAGYDEAKRVVDYDLKRSR